MQCQERGKPTAELGCAASDNVHICSHGNDVEFEEGDVQGQSEHLECGLRSFVHEPGVLMTAQSRAKGDPVHSIESCSQPHGGPLPRGTSHGLGTDAWGRRPRSPGPKWSFVIAWRS